MQDAEDNEEGDGKRENSEASDSELPGRLIDVVLTYAILFVVIAAVYPLLNKELLETAL